MCIGSARVEYLQRPEKLQHALAALRGATLTEAEHRHLRHVLRMKSAGRLTVPDAASYALLLHFAWNGQEKNYTRREDRPVFPRRRCSTPPPNVSVRQTDAFELLHQLKRRRRAFLYLDPPYPVAGPKRYVYGGSLPWHEELARKLRRCKIPFILSLPDTTFVRELYQGCVHLVVRPGELLVLGPRGRW